MACRRALDQGVHRLVGLGASDRAAIPRMIGVANAALRLFVRARPYALSPSNIWCFPGVPMPTGPTVKFEVALLRSSVLAALGKLLDERKLAVVAVIDRARLVLRLADHCRKRAQTHAVQSAEVDPFGRFSVE